jgi:hypothetical protein
MEERLRLGAPPRALEGALARPAGADAGAVVCHPHPRFGGSMDNPLIVAVAEALTARGHVSLRFNFGGVGTSEGVCTDGPEEVRDVRAALAALVPRLPDGARLVLAGYSFGAWAALRAVQDGARVDRVIAVAPPLTFFDWSFLDAVDPPVTLVAGDRDRFCPAERATALADRHRMALCTIADADHFFAGREQEVAAAVAAAARR